MNSQQEAKTKVLVAKSDKHRAGEMLAATESG
jgi:hypothetical protein